MDNSNAPPEALQALCAICDVRWAIVQGRPGRVWKVYTQIRGVEFARNISTTEYATWVDICEWLCSKRARLA